MVHRYEYVPGVVNFTCQTPPGRSTWSLSVGSLSTPSHGSLEVSLLKTMLCAAAPAFFHSMIWPTVAVSVAGSKVFWAVAAMCASAVPRWTPAMPALRGTPASRDSLYRAALSMDTIGGQVPAWASPVTTNPWRS
jgi:hypothetical protein